MTPDSDTSQPTKSPDDAPAEPAPAEAAEAAVDALVAEETERAQREPVDWDTARELYERHGMTVREIGDRVGVSFQTVAKRAKREFWERDDEVVSQRDAARRAQTQAAIEASRAVWAQRRAEEADDAGASAKIARLIAVRALQEGNDRLARAAAVLYGIFIDKAQLLTGGVTSRTDVTVVSEGRAKVASMRDEVEERRKLRDAQLAAS